MESNSKLVVLLVLLVTSITAIAGGKNSPPDDILTIEALIDAHKKMKQAEDLAVLELTATAETQTLTEKIAGKYNETRKMLNQRLADVGSALTLASSLASVTLQLKNLTESYAEFTETAYKNAKRQPFLMVMYTSANLQIADEIKNIVKSCGDFALFQTNVLKSTMEEKRKILGFISALISSVQRIINKASMSCRSMLAVGVKEYHVQEIINSKTNKELMKKIVEKWKRKDGQQLPESS